MVVGNGMVAQKFDAYKKNDAFLIFASGVSNSKSIDITAFDREINLIKDTIKKYPERIFVYFSTCSIYDPEEMTSYYVLHKRKIEDLIQKSLSNYYIFRVSNLVGKSTNYNTILNFFHYHIVNKINFTLWSNSSRNLIDIDDMFQITNDILSKRILQNQIINIANPKNYNVKDIVASLELETNTKANYIPIQKGSDFSIDISLILPVIREMKIQFGDSYLSTLIKKYYLHK
jgi:nucleoside-diphosphate-sugar epimerase